MDALMEKNRTANTAADATASTASNSDAASRAKGRARKHSSLYDKSLPRFEVSRGYEDYARSDHRMKPRPAVQQDDAASGAAASNSVKSEAGELSLEEQMDAVLRAVGNQRALQEVLYKLMLFCQEQRTQQEAEDFIAHSDEFVYSHIIQSPTSIVGIMVKNHGLSSTQVDAQGEPVTQERSEGLSADELDDLICGTLLKTTPAGVAVTQMISPAKRFEAQLGRNRGRTATFYAILEFCAQEPRKFPQIKEFYTQHDEFSKSTAMDSQQLACDFYVDKLECAGMLVWRGQWEVTQAGRDALAAREA